MDFPHHLHIQGVWAKRIYILLDFYLYGWKAMLFFRSGRSKFIFPFKPNSLGLRYCECCFHSILLYFGDDHLSQDICPTPKAEIKSVDSLTDYYDIQDILVLEDLVVSDVILTTENEREL
jgi:hypothetical protein